MRILITTGLSEADIGGPFQYAPRLKDEFEKMGHQTKVLAYGQIEKILPVGLRHMYFFLKIFPRCLWADYVLTLDTFSVGVPSVMATVVCNKKSIVRIGGDSLWSAYVNRTGATPTLPNFYQKMPLLNAKEKLIYSYMRSMIERADFLAFNTEWQRKIWREAYGISEHKSGVVRNFIPEKREGKVSKAKNFLWAGRVIPEKNPNMLKRFGVDIVNGESHEKVLEKIKNSYVAVSLAFTDICPNFIIEAVSFGKPFIMTRETGLSEIFPKGGIFVNPMEEKDIEMAIEAMLDPHIYSKHIEELKSVNINHPWSQIAQELLDIWRKCP